MITGLTAYEGPSVLDKAPITCVVTLSSSNQKTGNMLQTWILRADVDPVTAVKEGKDSSVCGSCPHRHFLNGACYVLPFQAPQMVWKRWKAGLYPSLASLPVPRLLAHLQGRALRMGSYGDPAAVPYPVWQGLVAMAGSHTGYTHQVRHPAFDRRLLELCMVSADTPKQAQSYWREGLRTFRVKDPDLPVLEGETYCPAESGVQCRTCLKCAGGRAGPSVTIDVHGSFSSRYLPSRQHLIATDAAARQPALEV